MLFDLLLLYVFSFYVSLVCFVFTDCYIVCVWYVIKLNRIVGIMVSVLSLGTVDRGFEPRSGQTKDYKTDICCFSAKHATLRRNNKY